LACGSNPLTSLDVSNNPALIFLECEYNILTNLSVSNNPALWQFNCGGNLLIGLDVAKNTAIGELTLVSMPSLYKVCVWEMPFPPTGVTVDTTDSPNVYFTTDCG
jgi:hypothetical protein